MTADKPLVAAQGRVAEELIYGKDNVTDGASSDISNATSIASNMVRRFGFSEAIGPVSHMNDSDQPAPSEETQRLIDGEIKGLIEKAQDRAREVLTAKKDELERLARALVEYETLDNAEVQKGASLVCLPLRLLRPADRALRTCSHQGRADPEDGSRVDEPQACVTMYSYSRNSSLEQLDRCLDGGEGSAYRFAGHTRSSVLFQYPFRCRQHAIGAQREGRPRRVRSAHLFLARPHQPR